MDNATVLQGSKSRTFETAAIHVDDSAESGMHSVQMQFQGGRFHASHVSLKMLIANAFDTDEDQVEGPPWITEETYTIDATLEGQFARELQVVDFPTRSHEQRKLLQNLLLDRFRLKYVCKDEVRRIFNLVAAKKGVLLQAASKDRDYAGGVRDFVSGAPVGRNVLTYRFMGGSVDISSQAGTVAQLIHSLNQNALSLQLHRKIVDQTNLPGEYDFALAFAVPWSGHMPDPAGLEELSESEGQGEAPLAESLEQQLGLTLVPRRGPVPLVEITAIEHPTEN